jgi:hypothetical protein
LKKQNIPTPAQVGWVKWGHVVSGRYPRNKHFIYTLVNRLQDIFYNSREPGKRYIVFINLLSRRLRRL